MSRKRDIGHDGIQEEILRKLEDSSTQRQIDIGGGVVVNITQEDYGKRFTYSPMHSFESYCTLHIIVQTYNFKHKIFLCKKHYYNYWSLSVLIWVVIAAEL